MTVAQQLACLVPAAYLLGSVPFGLIIGLSRGVDPRRSGSGNIGATNVGRLLGGKFFALVFMLDMLKGLLPTLAASLVVWPGRGQHTAGTHLLWLGVGFAAIAGHMFSIFLKFRGGKGVATSAGVMLGIFPDYTLAAAVVLVIWGLCFAATRIVSLSSMLGAVCFPAVYAIGCAVFNQPIVGARWPLLVFAVLIALAIVWKHRGNIARLRAGTEPQFVKKKSVSAEKPAGDA